MPPVKTARCYQGVCVFRYAGDMSPRRNIEDAVRITVSALRKRLGAPWIIATVAGVGYRVSTQRNSERDGGDRG